YSALAADYGWMYHDGVSSGNPFCATSADRGCWGHRHAILSGLLGPIYMGAAVTFTSKLGPGYGSWAMLLAGTGGVKLPVIYPADAVSPTPPSHSITLTRIAGPNRIATAVATSKASYPTAGSAGAVVLASDAAFPDALSGTPLAAAKHAPVLLTPPGALAAPVGAEIARVLPAGGTVYVLGGTEALSHGVAAKVESLGFKVTRVAGPNRFATAVAVAKALGSPSAVFEATGTTFAAALVAGPAAAKAHGVVLLTNGAHQSPATSAYLAAHSGKDYAIGAQATAADPSATSITGPTPYATAVAVATHFWTAPTAAGFASGASWADSLSGGAQAASEGSPVLLVPPAGPLPKSLTAYLSSHPKLVKGHVYGGTAAVGLDVLTEVTKAG
ncbi:MAG: cell wall-binding repeat-containing protein, partial [Acidimicrobiales bacterium]